MLYDFKNKIRKCNLPFRKVVKMITLAPGIILFSNVIPEHEVLIESIESGIKSSEWELIALVFLLSRVRPEGSVLAVILMRGVILIGALGFPLM